MLDGKEDNQTRRAYLSDEERLAEDKETCKEQIAKLEAENQRLRDKIQKIRDVRIAYCDKHLAKQIICEILEERDSYESERQRLRDALVSIADGDIYPRTIAKQALEKEA